VFRPTLLVSAQFIVFRPAIAQFLVCFNCYAERAYTQSHSPGHRQSDVCDCVVGVVGLSGWYPEIAAEGLLPVSVPPITTELHVSLTELINQQ